jgi:chemosensory pili system protein ChpA (sensor histidine kinase/response regulator)
MRDQVAPSAEVSTALLDDLESEGTDEADEAVAPGSDLARVPVSHLDGFLSDVGEVSMFRSRLEQQLVGLAGGLRDLDQTIARLRAQMRDLESATDAQIQARVSGMQQSQAEGDRYAEEYDPLEMDRYTRMQELTRSITESIADLASVHRSMRESVGEGEAMVLQQARLSTTLQEGLLSTLAVPFGRQEGRLARVLRQAAQDEDKAAELRLDGAEVELDRNVLERIVPAIEHILRNSVTHGIEDTATRAAANKPASGQVSISVRRDNNRVVLDIRDDGRGLDYDLIRAEAVRRGLLAENTELSADRIAQFIFEPGFSTAKELSLSAGRGVGMDVVAAEVRQLGGRIDVGSEVGLGCQFTISLPFSVAVTQTLLVRSGEAEYAIPLASITGVARLPVAEVQQALSDEQPLEYAGASYEVHELAPLVQARAELPASGYVPVLFVAAGGEASGGRHFAVVVEHLLGTREVVAKTVGPQIATAPGVAGATIQPDGRVVLIMDLGALIQELERRGLRGEPQQAPEEKGRQPLVMVIDDSITMRKVAERIVGRAGYRVQLSKDGADGVAQLQTVRPDLVLLDIEMPRMDGFEVASFIRNDANLQSVPILMITSRSGDKHRQRAAGLEVNGYLIKPYQEQQLLGDIAQQLREPTPMSASA